MRNFVATTVPADGLAYISYYGFSSRRLSFVLRVSCFCVHRPLVFCGRICPQMGHIFHHSISGLAPRPWEPSLQSNAVSHWLGANLESALYFINIPTSSFALCVLSESTVSVRVPLYLPAHRHRRRHSALQ